MWSKNNEDTTKDMALTFTTPAPKKGPAVVCYKS